MQIYATTRPAEVQVL